jgi:sugar diacid utilization regulator/GAF domain-containing protein
VSPDVATEVQAPPAGRASGFARAPVEVELRTLQELATDILSRLDIEETLLSVLNAAVKLLDADIGGILLADGDGVRMRACTGNRTIATARLYVGRGQGVAGRVFETGKPFKVDDYETDSVISRHFVQIARDEGKRSALGAPMIVRGETIGTLMVWRRRPSVFTEEDTTVLSSLGNLAAIAIVNAELHETQRLTVERLESANARLETQNDLLQRSSELHDELTSLVLEGRDLNALVQIVAKHAKGRAAILHGNLSLLADSGAGPELVERISAHLGAPDEPGAQATSIVNPDESCASWLLFTTVAASNDVLGYLCVELSEPPQLLEPVILEQAAIVCALHLVNQQGLWEAQARMHSEVLWDLLEGNGHDEAETRLRASHLGLTLPDRVRVALVEIDGDCDEGSGADLTALERRRSLLVRAIERAARDAGHEHCFAARRGSIIALLVAGSDDVDRALALGQAVVKGLKRSHPALRSAVGVSGCQPFAADLTQAHAQATQALAAASLIDNETPIAVFDGLGVLRFLLGSSDHADISKFARSVLGPVLDYDAAHPIELVKTLEAYLSADCNLQRTADSLYVHAKTVRYRLDRIQAMSGLDLGRQDDRFHAQLALTMVRALALGRLTGATAS